MYSKQEIAKQKQEFWTAFGKYMKPVHSADGEVVSWSNYKTGIGGISFKMDADSTRAVIAIVFSQTDTEAQQQYYNHLLQLRALLYSELEEDDWNWQAGAEDEWGKTISQVSKQLTGVSIHRTEDWPAIISFLKPRIVALDAFWSMAKYGFGDL